MYDFMIIDDDLSIREHLKSMIEWHHLPLNLVCEAGDSDTARELYDIYHPKIIMTDIHIPIISGLELAQEISKRDPETRFIVITGYNDFEYVKDSVTLGAVDLLSKPLLPDAVNASLSKAIAYFDHLRSESASSQAMKQLLEDNLPMLREKFIAHLLKHQTAIAHDDMIDKCHMLGIDIMGDHYAVVIISLDLGIPAPKNAEALLAATRNTAEEIISANSFKFFSFYDDYYRLNLLISWNHENGDEEIEACMHDAN